MTGAGAKHDPPTRVMVVDDHPMWRDSVSRDLSEAGFEVVAATGEGLQAMRIAAPVRPDVVVLDLQLPDVSGVDVTRGVLAAYPRAKVLILSASGEHRDVLDAVKAGAAGYILKSASRAEFLDAVRRTAAGDAVVSPGLAGLVLGEFRRRLTEEERRLADLRGEGYTWEEIAARVGGTPQARRKQLARAVDRVARELELDG